MHLPGALRTIVSRLSRRRGFLALTVAVLGLGLGGALTVLEIADALFWRPLPYADAERLVFAWQVDSRGTRLTVTGGDFLSWSGADGPFAAIAAVSARGFNLASDGEPERVEGALVSADFFQVLGARPLLGRVVEPGPARPRVVVLSESFWRRRFGADPTVLGRTSRSMGNRSRSWGSCPRPSGSPSRRSSGCLPGRECPSTRRTPSTRRPIAPGIS
jgi:putative ABC transport system permease protein